MTHIDLFSGIAGFAYAARQVWGDEYENVLFCDNNKFCQEVIKKNFGKESLIYGDIREVTMERVIADTYHRGQAQQKQQTAGDKQCDREIVTDTQSWESRQSPQQEGREDFSGRNLQIDLLTGGFPCQPFSCAGQKRGTEDDRHLWPEMFRVIKDFKPRWIIAENVRGLINIQDGVAFQQVFLDLEGEGYETQAFIIPACAVNAPHRRDRVWIIAKRPTCDDTKSKRRDNGNAENEKPTARDVNTLGLSDSNAPNTKKPGLQGRNTAGDGCAGRRNTKYTWDDDWRTVATSTCSRGVDDGLPERVDRPELSAAQHRVERLKSLGNAIVPQVTIEIMKAIKYADDHHS